MSNFTWAGTRPKSVIFNGNRAKAVTYNGTVIWRAEQEIYREGTEIVPLWAGLNYTNEGGVGWGSWDGQGNKRIGVNDYFAQIEYLASEVYMHARGYYSANGSSCYLNEQTAIDLTFYDKLIVEMRGNSPARSASASGQQIANGTYLIVTSGRNAGALGGVVRQQPIAVTSTYSTYEMDVSDLSGPYYIGAFVGSNAVYNPEAWLRIKSMKLV